MTLIQIEGDLVELAYGGQFDYVVHGCNCFHKMKSGIAGAIAKKFPKAILADFGSAHGQRKKLGTWTEAIVSGRNYRTFHIINAYTQFTYSRSQDVFEYGAFESFLRSFENALRDRAKGPGANLARIRVGFPKIGCGLAGGDEGRILDMLEGFADKTSDIAEVSLVVLPPGS